jgi:hypothetical protein
MGINKSVSSIPEVYFIFLIMVQFNSVFFCVLFPDVRLTMLPPGKH